VKRRHKTLREFLFDHLQREMEDWDRSLRFRGDFHDKPTRIKFRDQYAAAIRALRVLEDAELPIEIHLSSYSDVELGTEKSVAQHIEELTMGPGPSTIFPTPWVVVRLAEIEVNLPKEYWK
jgi:hypothetical protein